jgi:predicted glutamine amidotransferase
MDELLYQPDHSLINQSYNAIEMEEPLNGDGFGVGWYEKELSENPALFTSVSPAWNNRNLQNLAPRIKSSCIFAHVRAASVGDVTQNNCHPFNYRNILMMHNGGIDQFKEIKRPLLDRLSEKRFHSIKGETDSEHLFALFLDHLFEQSENPELNEFCNAFFETFSDLEKLKNRYGLKGTSKLNILITNGKEMIGSRYVSGSDETPLTLHHSEGKKYQCKDGYCHMQETDKPHEKAILLVSEKLTDHDEDWSMVPANHLVTVDSDLNVEFAPISF